MHQLVPINSLNSLTNLGGDDVFRQCKHEIFSNYTFVLLIFYPFLFPLSSLSQTLMKAPSYHLSYRLLQVLSATAIPIFHLFAHSPLHILRVLPTYTFQGTLRTNILYGIHYNLGDLHGLVLGLSKVFRNRDCNLASQKGTISVPLLIGAICIWIFITKTRCEMGLDIGRPILLNVLRYITQTEPSCWLNLCNHRFIPTKTQTYGDPQNCL